LEKSVKVKATRLEHRNTRVAFRASRINWSESAVEGPRKNIVAGIALIFMVISAPAVALHEIFR
jgi:hypothetical protein